MTPHWVQLYHLPRMCKGIPEAQWTPAQRYRYQRSRERYDKLPDAAEVREMFTEWAKGGYRIGSYSNVVIHE